MTFVVVTSLNFLGGEWVQISAQRIQYKEYNFSGDLRKILLSLLRLLIVANSDLS